MNGSSHVTDQAKSSNAGRGFGHCEGCRQAYPWRAGLVLVEVKVDDIAHFCAATVHIPVMAVKWNGAMPPLL